MLNARVIKSHLLHRITTKLDWDLERPERDDSEKEQSKSNRR